MSSTQKNLPHPNSTFTRQLQALRASLPPGTPDPLIDPPPDAFLRLWESARAAGIVVSKLFVVRQPLDSHAAGAYSVEHHDIWIWSAPEMPEEQVLRTLLHELAHAQCPPNLPYASFEEEWAEERATWQRAIALAHRWDVAHLFPEGTIAEIREEVEACLQQRLAASAILGSTDMGRTEQALRQIRLEAHARGWTGQLLHEVLTGTCADPGYLGQVLTFDRCVLHACWETVHEPEADPDPETLFGPLSHLYDATRLIRAVEMLQRALAFCARQEEALRARLARRSWHMTTSGKVSYEQSRQIIHDETALQEAIALVNQLCFEARGYALRMHWQGYETLFAQHDQKRQPAHLYCLRLIFTPWTEVLTTIAPWMDTADFPPCPPRHPRAIWFLFPSGQDMTPLEAAWQLFVLSWVNCAQISYEGFFYTPMPPLQDSGESQRATALEGLEGV